MEYYRSIAGKTSSVTCRSQQNRLAQAALESRTDELERINGLMVNRELQMIDLKKQIADLKAQKTTTNQS